MKKAPARSKQGKSKVETVLVTGASGSVGHLLTALLVEGGRNVIASDLPGTELPGGDGGKIVQRPGDLTSASFVQELVRGVDHVVHSAALIDIGLPYEKLKPVNVDATRALYEASRKQKVKRFVFFSSGSIYKQRRDGVYCEDCRVGAGNDYERSKIECEEFLRAESRGGPPGVTIVRPALIYGPRNKMLAATFMVLPPILALAMPKQVVLNGGPRSNWAHAEDVARAVAFILDHPETAGETYNVADDLRASVGEILEFVTEAYGYPKGLTIPYPLGLLRQIDKLPKTQMPFDVITWFLQEIWKFVCKKNKLNSQIKPKVDLQTMPYAVEDAIFDNRKLKAAGFQYKHPSSRVGILRTIRWYQEEGWVPRAK